jgi:hypothetical protein
MKSTENEKNRMRHTAGCLATTERDTQSVKRSHKPYELWGYTEIQQGEVIRLKKYGGYTYTDRYTDRQKDDLIN